MGSEGPTARRRCGAAERLRAFILPASVEQRAVIIVLAVGVAAMLMTLEGLICSVLYPRPGGWILAWVKCKQGLKWGVWLGAGLAASSAHPAFIGLAVGVAEVLWYAVRALEQLDGLDPMTSFLYGRWILWMIGAALLVGAVRQKLTA